MMKSRGGPYAGLDIPEFFALVEELFDPEEAEINNALSRKPTPANEIATKTGRSPILVPSRTVTEQRTCYFLDG